MNLRSILALLFLLELTACGEGKQKDGNANELSYQMFKTNSNWPSNPLEVARITAPIGADIALPFSGTLSSQATIVSTNGPRKSFNDLNYNELPHFEVDLFSDGNRLVPVQRTILAGDENSFWKFIFSPGRIWAQDDDNGMSRAQIPITLVNSYYANAHNGLLTFLYDEEGVTSGWIQIFQENVDWLKYDYWGALPLEFSPLDSAELSQAKELYQLEKELELPMRSWDNLPETVKPEMLQQFNSGIDNVNLSSSGLVFEDTIYTFEPQTRFGKFPYPKSMRHSVYSTSKSMAAAIGLFHLAQVYGRDILDLEIIDYMIQPGLHSGWSGVTFSHALSMATGTGDNQPSRDIKAVFADESFDEDSKLTQFYREPSGEGKLNIAYSFGNYDWGPDEVMRYNTTITYLLGEAMQNFLQTQGETRSLWQVLQEDVYEKMGIYSFNMMQTYNPHELHSRPVLGVGIYPTVQDAAKIALLFQNEGRWKQVQLLHRELVDEIMNFTQGTGLPAEPSESDIGRRYHHSFWAQPFEISDDCTHMVPFMFGYGNNYVIIPNNGVIVYRFQDAFESEKLSMLKVADALSPICN